MTERDNIIRSRRLARGLTQLQLAEKMGMDRSQMNQTERGKRQIGRSVAARLAEHLGGEPEEYMTASLADAVTLAKELVSRADAGEDLPPGLLERVASQVEETGSLAHRLAARLREVAATEGLQP